MQHSENIQDLTNISPTYGLNSNLIYKITDALISDELKAKELLMGLHKADLAELINNTTTEQKQNVLRILGNSFDPEILITLDASVRSSMISTLTSEQLYKIGELEAEKIFTIFEELSPEEQSYILSYLPRKKHDIVQKWLAYPENTAGRMMHKQFVVVQQDFTVEQAIQYLRDTDSLPSEFYKIFVVDEKYHVVGSVLVSQLIRNRNKVLISSIITEESHLISVNLDQEEVSYIFRQYGLVSAPVVDQNNCLVGIILIDDVVEVIEEETEEDIMKMVGINESDLNAPFLTAVTHRFPWLFVNLLIACITSGVIVSFNDTIHSLVTLAAIMPIVASMGGNAGTQTLTVSVRAIAHRKLNMINGSRVVLKEVITNVVSGVLLAILGGIIMLVWHKDLKLSLIFALAVVVNFAIAGFCGTMIPLLFTRMNADPAVASSVFLTAITDIVGFFIFLGLSSLLLL
ncbi:MAG: magnesium transporter [Rickettsiales endosymbiont of Dermacentor nuttalli]